MIANFSNAARLSVWIKDDSAVGGLISGIGDAAYWGPAADATPTILGFRQGGRSVRLLVGPGGSKTMDLRKLEAMARRISARMGR
jgi:hypothetical protein